MSSRKQSSKNIENDFTVDKTAITISNRKGDWIEIGELDDIEGNVHGLDINFSSQKDFGVFIEKLQKIYELIEKNV